MMVTLQDTPVDKAMYYDASVTCFYCGMFSPMNGEPFKAYYSFKAFNELYKLKNRVECTASGSIKTLAASDGKKNGGAGGQRKRPFQTGNAAAGWKAGFRHVCHRHRQAAH